MSSRLFVMPCVESSYGVAKATPTKGTDYYYLRLPDQAAFEAELTPAIDVIPYGGGRTSPADEVADVAMAAGSFAFPLYPGIWTGNLLGWATTPIDSGRTVPWATTDASYLMPPGDLASLSFFRAFLNIDGTYTREQWNGCKCTKATLSASEDGSSRKWILSGSFVGIKSATNSFEASPPSAPSSTVMPAPAETDYPVGPWTFGHMFENTGTFTVGSALLDVSSVSISWDNKVDVRTYGTQFARLASFRGRSITIEADLRYRPTPDLLAAFQARTVEATSIILDNGAHTLNMQFNGKNRINQHARQFAPDKEFSRKVTVQTYWDPNATTPGDFTFTTT